MIDGIGIGQNLNGLDIQPPSEGQNLDLLSTQPIWSGVPDNVDRQEPQPALPGMSLPQVSLLDSASATPSMLGGNENIAANPGPFAAMSQPVINAMESPSTWISPAANSLAEPPYIESYSFPLLENLSFPPISLGASLVQPRIERPLDERPSDRPLVPRADPFSLLSMPQQTPIAGVIKSSTMTGDVSSVLTDDSGPSLTTNHSYSGDSLVLDLMGSAPPPQLPPIGLPEPQTNSTTPYPLRRQASNSHVAAAFGNSDHFTEMMQGVPQSHQDAMRDSFNAMRNLGVPYNRYSVNQFMEGSELLPAIREIKRIRQDNPLPGLFLSRAELLERRAYQIYDYYAHNHSTVNMCAESTHIMRRLLTEKGIAADHLVGITVMDNLKRDHQFNAYALQPRIGMDRGQASFPLITLDAWIDQPLKVVRIEDNNALIAHLMATLDAVAPKQVNPADMKFNFW